MNISDQKDSLSEMSAEELPPPTPTPDLKLVESAPETISCAEEMKPSHPSSHIMVRIFGLSFKLISSKVGFFWKGIMMPVLGSFSQSTGKTLKTIKEKKEKRELALHEYVSKLETKFDVGEAKKRIQEIESVGIKEEYESKVRRYFDEGVCSVSMESGSLDPKMASKSLAFGMDLYQYIALKLKESGLGTNVEYMGITTTVDKLRLTHVVEFELKSSGQNWAPIFSKYVGKDVFHKIEWAGGVVDGHHTQNLTLQRDTFVFAFSHERMEFLEAMSVTKNHKPEINQDM